MKDKLEKYIISNREGLDSKAPGDLLWNRIDEQLHSQPKSDRFAWVWKAAAVVLLGVSTLLMYQKQQLKQQQQATIVEDKEMNESLALDADFEEAEFYYTAMIEEKKQEIASFEIDDPELRAGFKADLDELDTLYLELKSELFETSNEKVMEALIENLRLRIEILNRQLDILEKIKNYQNEEAPKVPTV